MLAQALEVIQDKLPAEVETINAWATSQGCPYQITMPTADCIYSLMTFPHFFAGYPAIALCPGDQAPNGPEGIAAPHQVEYKLGRQWVCDVLEVGEDWVELSAKLSLWDMAIFEVLGDTDCLDCGHTLYQGSAWQRPRQTQRTSQDLMQDLPFVFTTSTHEYTLPTLDTFAGAVEMSATETGGTAT